MIAVAATDRYWAIGYQGHMLVYLPEDLKHFRSLTTGKTIVYGRKTLLTFPGEKPLPERKNIILSGNPDFHVEDAVVVNSIEELLEILPENTDDVMVIGGGVVYHELLPYCDKAMITRIEAEYEADTHMDNMDEDPEWVCTERGENKEYNGVIFHYDIYERVKE
ncbi:MAG: dihydrofolate reductase [Solobacterium sp.]|nr:dihydrofolate reductase [Solobacterium sp.]